MMEVSGQSIDQDWQEPTNLSNSGSTQKPAIVIGASGTIHTLWQDEYAGFVYRNFKEEWSQSYNLDLVFYGYDYKLVADGTGWVYAFWINESNNGLYATGVREGDMTKRSNWISAMLLANGVVAFDVSVDTTNQIHLVFTRARETEDLPAGIYYQRSPVGISGWDRSINLYQSKYYRDLIPPIGLTGPDTVFSLDRMHVDVETALIDGNINVYAGWENQSLKRLFYTQSQTSGQTWSTVEEISAPSNELIYVTPIKLRTIANESKLLQIWELSEPGGNCNLFYRTSQNNGLEWTSSQSLENVFGKCPDKLSWYRLTNGEFLFVHNQAQVVSFTAWNGANWSIPQAQETLSRFYDPMTLNQINLSAFNYAVIEDKIHLIGLDEAESKDIWYTNKQIGDRTNWYLGSGGWSPIQSIHLENGPSDTLFGFRGRNNLFHFVYVAVKADDPGKSALQMITHDPNNSPLAVVIDDKIPGTANQLAGTTNFAKERLALLWRGGEFGQIYFDWSFLNQADNPVGWSKSNLIQSLPTGLSPALFTTSDGITYALISVPYNDERGLYISQSQNGGENWSDPELIITPQEISNLCPLIDQPNLAVDRDNVVHILLTCSTFTGGSGPLSLYYLNNSNETWSTPQLVSDTTPTWNQIIADQNNRIHRLWKVYNGQSGLWHSYSSDSGQTWSSPANFALFELEAGPVAAILDNDNHIHVFQTVNQNGKTDQISYYFWNDDKWINRDNLLLNQASEGIAAALAAGIDRSGSIVLGLMNQSSITSASSQIIMAAYPLNMAQMGEEGVAPAETISNPETVSSTPAEDVIASVEPIQATETPVINTEKTNGISTSLSLVAGIGIAALFVIAFFAFIKFSNR